MKIKAVPIRSGDLRPGDLFSTVGPEHWERVGINFAIGEKVYIRTQASTAQVDENVYRIEIDQELPLHKNSVVQVVDKDHPFFPALVVVDEIKRWGIQGYVNVPTGKETHRAHVRVKWDSLVRVGQAIVI